jgi:hypothetical protein
MRFPRVPAVGQRPFEAVAAESYRVKPARGIGGRIARQWQDIPLLSPLSEGSLRG